jgi:5'-deoxynucleotidase YfbR-like HD superfamily hydrolase
MYALVHDLVEVYAGDTPAFPNTRVRKKYLKLSDKEERELRARKRIEVEFPHIASWIERYDSKVDEESMLVYSLEKLVTEINIYLDNGRSDKAQEVTLERKLAHLRPRISLHPLVLEHFDALMEYIKEYRADTCYTAPT